MGFKSQKIVYRFESSKESIETNEFTFLAANFIRAVSPQPWPIETKAAQYIFHVIF